MKPELQIAITNAQEVLRNCTWYQDRVYVRPEDLRQLLNAAKPKPVGIAVPAPEHHPCLNIRTFTPPEDFMDQIPEENALTVRFCNRLK
jgi:hypothetical protein